MSRAFIVRNSPANWCWWSNHRYLYFCHQKYRDINGVMY